MCNMVEIGWAIEEAQGAPVRSVVTGGEDGEMVVWAFPTNPGEDSNTEDRFNRVRDTIQESFKNVRRTHEFEFANGWEGEYGWVMVPDEYPTSHVVMVVPEGHEIDRDLEVGHLRPEEDDC